MANVRLRVLPQVLPVDGRPVEIQATDTYIQWRYMGDADWINLVALADLEGPPGPSIELRSDGTNIQYRIVGSGEDGWINIVPLADLVGPPGGPGPAGPGVPAGGTAGQVLGKVSGDDFDTEWIDPPNDFTSAVESRSWAIANLHPDVAPSYIRTAGYSSPGDTGGALYKKVNAEPSHQGKFSITLADAVTVVWYEIAESTLRPEMFGTIGVAAAGDTAAWVALVSTANARGGDVKVRLDGNEYLINGTGVDADSQTFVGQASVWVHMGSETAIRQQNALSKTLKFRNVTKARITGGHFYGYAQKQIDASQPLTELDLDSSSGNAVAAIYAVADAPGASLIVERVKTSNHFGRDIWAYGVQYITGRDLDLAGVGPAYNDPSGGAYPSRYPIPGPHQGNGEDAAIYAIPKDFTLAGTAWLQEVDVCNSRIKWHSFSIRTVVNRYFKLAGNEFDLAPGQYHIYDSDSDGQNFVGNTFRKARLASIKMQFENYAGFTYGPAYDPNKPGGYAVGDVVRASSILWVCTTAYNPAGAAFSPTNWSEHPRMKRRAGVFSGNYFEDNGGGAIAWIVSAPVNGRNIWNDGIQIVGNSVTGSSDGEAIRLERCINALVTGNTVRGMKYGILGRYFSGTIAGNDFRLTGSQAISLSQAQDTVLEKNRFWDCGLSGVDDVTRSPVVFGPLTADDPPLQKAAPNLFMLANEWIYTGGAAGSTTPSDTPGQYHFYCSNAGTRLFVMDSRGTATTKKWRHDGTVVYKSRNHWGANGFANTSQNEAAWTLAFSTDFDLNSATDTTSGVGNVLGTLITVLRAKDYI